MIDFQYLQTHSEAIERFDSVLSGSIKGVVYVGLPGVGKTELLGWLASNRCDASRIPRASIHFSGSSSEVRHAVLMVRILEQFTGVVSPEALDAFSVQRQGYVKQLLTSNAQIEQYIGTGDNNILSVNTSWQERASLAYAELTETFIRTLAGITSDTAVIFLDSFERNLPPEEKLVLDLVDQLISSIRNIRVVIATQRSLSRLPENTVSATIGPLNREESYLLLGQQGISDPRIQHAIYDKLSKGNPKIISLAVSAYEQATNRGLTLDPDEVPSLIKIDEAIEWVNSKTVSFLDEEVKKIIQYVSILREFNLESINATVSPELNKLGRSGFDYLLRFSFVERVRSKSAWTFSSVFRRILMYSFSEKEPAEFQAAHRRALEFSTSVEDSISSTYHKFFLDTSEALKEWNSERRLAKGNRDFTRVDTLFEIAQSNEFELESLEEAFVYMKKAHYLRQIGSLEISREEYEKSINLYREFGFTKDMLSAQHGYAVLLALQGSYDAAREKLETLSEIDPKDTYSKNTLASIEANIGNYEKARILLAESKKADPLNLSTLHISAQVELDAGDLRAAINCLELALSNFPEDLGVMQRLADIYRRRSDTLFRKARSRFGKDKKREDQQRALIFEFTSLANAGNLQEARSIFKQIHLLDPSLSDVLERWARSEQIKRNYQKSSVYYRIHLDYHPDNGKAWYSYGWMEFAARKNLDLASELFSKAIEVDSDLAPAWYYLGEIERYRGDFESASYHYERAYKSWDTNDSYDDKLRYNILMKWSKLSYAISDREKGAKLYEELYKVALPSTKGLILVRWSIGEFELGNYEEADYKIDRAIEYFGPGNYSVVTKLEQELSPSTGKVTDSSMKTAKKMVKKSKHKIITHLVLARLYRKSGIVAKAQSIIAQMSREFPDDPILSWEMERQNKS